MFALVREIARPLVTVTRWGLDSQGGDTFDILPESKCTACGALGFGDESRCVRCGAPLADFDGELIDERAAPDRYERQASQIVRMLLDGKHLELTTPRSRDAVAGRLVFALESRRSAAQVLDLLIRCEDVAEVYCDTETLARLILESEGGIIES